MLSVSSLLSSAFKSTVGPMEAKAFSTLRTDNTGSWVSSSISYMAASQWDLWALFCSSACCSCSNMINSVHDRMAHGTLWECALYFVFGLLNNDMKPPEDDEPSAAVLGHVARLAGAHEPRPPSRATPSLAASAGPPRGRHASAQPCGRTAARRVCHPPAPARLHQPGPPNKPNKPVHINKHKHD
jgi:hypothetical protein